MYLDTDVILAELKVDDWLSSEVDLGRAEAPKTTVATGIEIQYVMEDTWERERLANVHDELLGEDVELVPLSTEVMDAAADLRTTYESVNVFDSIHLGTAKLVDEPIVSTDTLFPSIREVEYIDPREI